MRKPKTLKDTLTQMALDKDISKRLCDVLIDEATNGNLKAIDIIRDVIGEKNTLPEAHIKHVSHIKIEVVDAKTTQN